MTWVGIDDTDSPAGGCTTHMLTRLLESAAAREVDLIGYPRLVRLNPNAPGKTRGNAALSARFGRGSGRRWLVGRSPAGPVYAFQRGRPLPPRDEEDFLESAWELVRRESRPEAGTDPALVAHRRRLPASLYWEAVHRQLSLVRVESLLLREGARLFTGTSRVGAVGAAASISWPGAHPTWELIAYRPALAQGTRRGPDVRSLRRLERRYPELFQCRDERTRRVLVSPHTPCPILYGLRATDPGRLPHAMAELRTESVDRWLVFRTNQGTGDHLRDLPLEELRPYDAARVSGEVVGPATSVRGGHWRFVVRQPSGGRTLECIAFEPTKTLPALLRTLAAGDRVRLWGGLGAGASFRVEGVELLEAVARWQARSPRRCPACRKRLRSLGQMRGYRCGGCSARYPPELGTNRLAQPAPALGVYHPTPSARRHLAPRAPETADGRTPAMRLPRRSRTDLYA
ncbi:MAG: DUF1743 domain-containing protein [Thermoplasmata archaeon]|nr:DUF1743 domain-containing protein [Thermoplasmata archaeon]